MYRVHYDVLDDYLREQDGVITLAQARRCRPESSTPSAGECESGHWRRCSEALYFAETDHSPMRRGFASQSGATARDAAASGLAAAWWHGLTRFAPDLVEVTVPTQPRGGGRDGTTLRRRDLAPADIVERNGCVSPRYR